MKEYSSVKEYFADFTGEKLEKMVEMKAIIEEAVPQAVELISYGMPAYKLNSKPLAYYAPAAKHFGFYPTPGPIEAHKSELKKYKYTKGAVQFPYGEELPKELIVRLLQMRAKEIG